MSASLPPLAPFPSTFVLLPPSLFHFRLPPESHVTIASNAASHQQDVTVCHLSYSKKPCPCWLVSARHRARMCTYSLFFKLIKCSNIMFIAFGDFFSTNNVFLCLIPLPYTLLHTVVFCAAWWRETQMNYLVTIQKTETLRRKSNSSCRLPPSPRLSHIWLLPLTPLTCTVLDIFRYLNWYNLSDL